MSGDDTSNRKRRPEPARTAPDRTGWSAGQARADAGDTKAPEPFSTSPAVSQIVADAVRMGYDVIGLNLADGRAAADRYSDGTYMADDIPHDVSRLGKRLLQLSRDLSTTGFDLMAAVLNDPAIRTAIQPRSERDPDRPPPPQTGPAQVTCVFRGRRAATAMPATLQRPDAPTMLSVAGLRQLDGDAPLITRVAFGPAHLGGGVIATITIPDSQPPGKYAGDVNDAATGQTLGTLTIEVLADVRDGAAA